MNKLPRLLTIVCLTLLCAACTNEQDLAELIPDDARLNYDDVVWQSTLDGGEQTRLITQGNTQLTFTATITHGSDFCSFNSRDKVDTASGNVGKTGVFIYLDRNQDESDRTVEIRVTFSNGKFDKTLRLVQRGYSTSAIYDRHKWVELPTYEDNSDYIYKTYYTTLTHSSSKVRNYSVCYDTKRHISHWVAYPLHTCYITPSLPRVNAFGYDPNDQEPEIPLNMQQNINSGYGARGYDRGHMLPNASRYNNYDTNRMTYYGTNMMPQHSGLNQNVWAELESKVRATMSSDTLYVVTGTHFATNTTIDNQNGPIAVPSHAYKVLLKAKKRVPAGMTIAELNADELLAIGFWFENSTAGQNTTIANAVRSVAEIEAMTGFEYFHMLADEVAKQVKQQKNLNDWSGF